MKEDKSYLISKKIRNKLIYYTYLNIKKKLITKNGLLINSMTSEDLNNKYQKYSEYCVEKIEEYSSQMYNGINNNYFHISVTYCSKNNNYHILVDKKIIDQCFGTNNIVGKYYKGNKIQIRTTTDKIKYNINSKENELKKKIIGENKFQKKKRNVSSLEVTKNIHIFDYVKNNEINECTDILNSNNYPENYKKLNKGIINIDNKKINSGMKIRKTNTQRIVNKY